MEKLKAFIPDIVKLCKLHKVKSLHAFGSILRDDYNNKSDVDLIVDFTSMPVEDYADNYFDFKFSLQNILKKPIDLLEEKAIKNPYFKKSVNEKKQLVYGG